MESQATGEFPGTAAVIPIAPEAPEWQESALRWAQETALPYVDTPPRRPEWHLRVGVEGLSLLTDVSPRPLRVQFAPELAITATIAEKKRWQRRHLSRQQPLARAIGRKVRTVVDATAGFGQDAFLLACLGYEVTAIERSPVMAALLRDGWRRRREDPWWDEWLGSQLRFLAGDAQEWLPRQRHLPDAIYVDPMFPPKRRASALPKKEIQVLRTLVGDDPDAAAWTALAPQYCTDRVVIKRPHHAPPLLANPQSQAAGKLVRYDVHLVSSQEQEGR